jgi:hypothetical protein
MHTFFHGWRRKAGCIALLMTCVTAAGWARSYLTHDSMKFRSNRQLYEIASVDGEIHLRQDIDWQSRLLIVPYSLQTIPMTLLSAYLILWKPRKRE